jgi:hypothetical protein
MMTVVDGCRSTILMTFGMARQSITRSLGNLDSLPAHGVSGCTGTRTTVL